MVSHAYVSLLVPFLTEKGSVCENHHIHWHWFQPADGLGDTRAWITREVQAVFLPTETPYVHVIVDIAPKN